MVTPTASGAGAAGEAGAGGGSIYDAGGGPSAGQAGAGGGNNAVVGGILGTTAGYIVFGVGEQNYAGNAGVGGAGDDQAGSLGEAVGGIQWPDFTNIMLEAQGLSVSGAAQQVGSAVADASHACMQAVAVPITFGALNDLGYFETEIGRSLLSSPVPGDNETAQKFLNNATMIQEIYNYLMKSQDDLSKAIIRSLRQ